MAIRGLYHTVELRKRVPVINAVNETVDTWPTVSDTLAANVQDSDPVELAQPDTDGPVVINCTIFTDLRTDIEHLDQLVRTDVSPERTYRVVSVKDYIAPRGSHLEIKCQRLLVLAEAAS